MTDSHLVAPIGFPVVRMWLAYRDKGILPLAGGWLDQPLDLLVQMNLIEMVATTFGNKDKVDWVKGFTNNQRALLRWLTNTTRT